MKIKSPEFSHGGHTGCSSIFHRQQPPGAMEGLANNHSFGYEGPCPKYFKGTHHYWLAYTHWIKSWICLQQQKGRDRRKNEGTYYCTSKSLLTD